jgi:hypothetical protein
MTVDAEQRLSQQPHDMVERAGVFEGSEQIQQLVISRAISGVHIR